MNRILHLLLLLLAFTMGCTRPQDGTMSTTPNRSSASSSETMSSDTAASFSSDLAFLRQHGDVHLLESPAGGRVALSAQYQGRVMTSAVSEDGLSFGWINRAFIEAGETGTPFDNYGGEDRFWLGPEGGQFALYFAPGAEFTLDDWQVPAALQEGAWDLVEASDTGVTYRREMHLENFSGASFDVGVTRTVRLLASDEIADVLGVKLPQDAQWVAFESVNRIENTGDETWTEDEGLLSIWVLGMFKPFGTSWVVVPYRGEPSDDLITDAYFGKVPEDRLEIREGYALFKADGEYRSKIGVPAQHAASVLGSYSPQADAITLVHFDRPEDAARYVNSLWEMQDEPYAGDVVNSYNDGPPNPGGFYELETSSPALALAPGESYTHVHRTVHVVASEDVLNAISEAALGVSTSEIVN